MLSPMFTVVRYRVNLSQKILEGTWLVKVKDTLLGLSVYMKHSSYLPVILSYVYKKHWRERLSKHTLRVNVAILLINLMIFI